MENLFPAGGWVDLSERTKLRLTGADRVRFLNGQVSNDVRLARAGEAMLACVMTIKGKMCADIWIHVTPDALLIDAEAELRESLPPRLERYLIADDVTLEDVTETLALIHVVAPQLLPSGKAGDRAARFNREGTDIFAPMAERAALRTALNGGEWDAGASEIVRIGEGIPRWGSELGEDTIPVEAGLETKAISYSKGCYIGQEVISRIKSVGHVNRHLVRLRSASALTPGARVRSAEGKEIGTITSAVSTSAGAWLALGYVRRGNEQAGTQLGLESGVAVEVW